MTKPSNDAPEAPKGPTDWERIEEQYRAGLLSVREIAAANGVSHTAIQKRAKTAGWERDLGRKIRSKADALVARTEVATQVATETGSKLATSERAIVEANAEVVASVRLSHRADIRRARKLAMGLLEELESQSVGRDIYDQVAELLADGSETEGPEVTGRMLELFRAVMSLPTRTKTMKDLADTLQKLVGLEREAYNIADAGKGSAPAPLGDLPDDSTEAARVYMNVIGR